PPAGPLRLPLLARLLLRLPVLGYLPARFIGLGFWRVRVEAPNEVAGAGGPPSQTPHAVFAGGPGRWALASGPPTCLSICSCGPDSLSRPLGRSLEEFRTDPVVSGGSMTLWTATRRLFRSLAQPVAPRRRRPCPRPSLEALEDRCVPSVFTVNTLADSA